MQLSAVFPALPTRMPPPGPVGIVAHLLRVNPDITLSQVRDVLSAYTSPSSRVTGQRTVDLAGALAAARQMGSTAGTSMATPQVVGAAGLALDANPDLTTSDLKQLLGGVDPASVILGARMLTPEMRIATSAAGG